MINLLDLEAPGGTAPERQSDEDAVVDWRARPAARVQVLEVLEGEPETGLEVLGVGAEEGDGVRFYLDCWAPSFTSALARRTRVPDDLHIKEIGLVLNV